MQDHASPPLAPRDLAAIRSRFARVRRAFVEEAASETEAQSRALLTEFVQLVRDDVPVLLFEIERLQAEVKLAVDLLFLEDLS